MRFLFALIGLLFDIAILIASCAGLYCAVRPDFFGWLVGMGTDFLSTDTGRLQVAGVSAVMILLSFRGFFLLMFGRSEQNYEIKRDDNGALSVSHTTLEHLIGRIASSLTPPATVRNLKLSHSSDGFRITLLISLDLTKCNLGEYNTKLNDAVKSYFKDSLGVPVVSIDLRAEQDIHAESK